jgi:DNA-binding Xre family transcriptional regulator
MDISYKRLWKMLIDRDLKKKDLQELTGISSSSIAKLGKNKPVTLEVLMKICKTLECNVGDIMDFLKENRE